MPQQMWSFASSGALLTLCRSTHNNAVRHALCTHTYPQIVKLRDLALFEALDYQQRKRALRDAVDEVAHMVSTNSYRVRQVIEK
jgi:hypothetical protein